MGLTRMSFAVVHDECADQVGLGSGQSDTRHESPILCENTSAGFGDQGRGQSGTGHESPILCEAVCARANALKVESSVFFNGAKLCAAKIGGGRTELISEIFLADTGANRSIHPSQ